MLPQCPKKVMNSAMDQPESKDWCHRNRDPTKCFDCPDYPQAKKKNDSADNGKSNEQLRLFMPCDPKKTR